MPNSVFKTKNVFFYETEGQLILFIPFYSKQNFKMIMLMQVFVLKKYVTLNII